MAGRPHSRAKVEIERERLLEARALPTEPRDQPEPYSEDLIPELMDLSALGLMRAEIAAHWAISEETLGEWEEGHHAFRDAAQRARTRSKAWWQRQPRLAIAEGNNKFPAGAWAQQVRACFAEYDDKSGPSLRLDVSGRLVIIDLRGPGPLEGRAVGGSIPLEGHATVRLDGGQTVGEGIQIGLETGDVPALVPPE